MTRVAITRSDRISDAIDQALTHLEPVDLVAGRVVAIKPNETYADADDSTGVTQPDTLRAAIGALHALGPSELVVSGGAGAAETDEVFRHSGMMEVVESMNVEFFDHNRPPFQQVALSYGRGDDEVHGPQSSVMVNPRVLTYETLVAVSQLKMHATATVTMALKNIAMSYPAADYYGHPRHEMRHHHEFFADMHSFIAAMAARFRIDLAITVGHPAMIGTGPLGGHTVETGLCIASRDPVAADAVGAKLLGFQPQAVRHIWEAERLGVGSAQIEEFEFPAMSLKEAIEAFTEAAYGEKLSFS